MVIYVSLDCRPFNSPTQGWSIYRRVDFNAIILSIPTKQVRATDRVILFTFSLLDTVILTNTVWDYETDGNPAKHITIRLDYYLETEYKEMSLYAKSTFGWREAFQILGVS